MAEDVLNPKLYRLLARRFGEVRVSNPGEEAQFVRRYNPRRRRKEADEIEAVHPGEYYQVCCPYCSDTRFRLYINHMFGQRGDEGENFLHMAICFNEDCLKRSGRVSEFIEDITETEGGMDKFRVKPGKKIDIETLAKDWPGPCTRVDKLPSNHKAVQYLVGRKFDPERIGRFYNAHFCHDSSAYWPAINRIIAPLYIDKRMVGWQGRIPDELNWKAENAPMKYYTCPGTPRRHVIYNFANAIQYRTGVVVEGFTDVWSFGPMCCSTLGASMTAPQQRRFIDHFKDHSAILLWDPEEYEKAAVRKLIDTFSTAFAGGFAAVRLPEGTDPGSLDRAFAREYVAAEAKKKGVEVSWSKR